MIDVLERSRNTNLDGPSQMISGRTRIRHSLCWVLQNPAAQDEPVWIEVSKLDESWQQSEQYVAPGGYRGESYKYERFGKWVTHAVKAHPLIWMPHVNLNECTGLLIDFTDGRHRFAWLRDHGVRRLPVTTDPAEAKNVRKQFGARGRTSILTLNATA